MHFIFNPVEYLPLDVPYNKRGGPSGPATDEAERDSHLSPKELEASFNRNIKNLTAEVDAAFRADQVLHDTIKSHLSERAKRTSKISTGAKAAFKNFSLSKVPIQLRKDPTYLQDGDDLMQNQKDIINRNIGALKHSNIKHSIQLTLSDNDLNKYNLVKRSSGSNSSFKVADLFDLINVRTVGTSIFNIPKTRKNDCAAEIEVKRRLDDIKRTSPDGEDLNKEDDNKIASEPSKLTAEKFVKESVEAQMRFVAPPEIDVQYGKYDGKVGERDMDESSRDDIYKRIETFRIKGGPADTVSYHDFYRIDIAFEHIWTELFDSRVPNVGQQLYEKLTTFGEAAPKSVNNVDDLKSLCKEGNTKSGETPDSLPFGLQWVRDVTLGNTKSGETPDSSPFGLQWVRDVTLGNTKSGESAPNMSPNPKSRLDILLDEIEAALKEEYCFKIFAPKSTNFGVLATYRQEWTPLDYQVGNLITTIPLAPQESRKYTKKIVIKKSRSVKEADNALNIRKKDVSDTARVDAEIVEKAQNKTDFNITAKEGFTIGAAEIDSTQSLNQSSSKESAQTKRELRESVLKSAEEYRQEHRIEIDTTDSQETEETSLHEIRNPNDEITVTYLFYELQRTYEISERLHKLTPVILVANDVPTPNEITESWIIRYSWILKRAILDDSFVPTLEYLYKNFSGLEASLVLLRTNMEKQQSLVDEVGQQLSANSQALQAAQSAVTQIATVSAAGHEVKGAIGWAESILNPLNFLSKNESTATDTLSTVLDSAKADLARIEKEAERLRSQLQYEVTALQAATDKNNAAIVEHYNHQTEIDRLRAHIKDNILYYMQAIWNHEPPDQRFFRLYDIKVPVIGADRSHPIPAKQQPKSSFDVELSGIGDGKVTWEVQLPWNAMTDTVTKSLVEIADLDHLLGYKGNYMIFPLKENNIVTYFMMQDYLKIGDIVTLRDPDEFGEYTMEEIENYLKCLYKNDKNKFKKEEDKFEKIIFERLTSPRLEKEKVIVPTTSLYIEALPGSHPLLENFKLIHRAIDVKKVQSEVRHAELENIRLGARALKGKYADPDIEKKIIIDGDSDSRVVTPDE